MDSEYAPHCILEYVLIDGSLPHNGVADMVTMTAAVNAGQYWSTMELSFVVNLHLPNSPSLPAAMSCSTSPFPSVLSDIVYYRAA